MYQAFPVLSWRGSLKSLKTLQRLYFLEISTFLKAVRNPTQLRDASDAPYSVNSSLLSYRKLSFKWYEKIRKMNACHRKSPEQLKKKAEAAKHDTGTEKKSCIWEMGEIFRPWKWLPKP